MSERDSEMLKRLEIKRGKRIRHSSPPRLEKHVQMRRIDPYNIDHALEFPAEQSQIQSSYQSDQRLTIRGNARNQFNGRDHNVQSLSFTNGKLTLLYMYICTYNITRKMSA